MTLTNQQRRQLKAKAHALKPIILIGANGVTEAVLAAIEEALEHHELIKVKVRAEERADKLAMVEAICKNTGATEVQLVGHNLTLYRRSSKPKIVLT
jgi:RNA-binding protein